MGRRGVSSNTVVKVKSDTLQLLFLHKPRLPKQACRLGNRGTLVLQRLASSDMLDLEALKLMTIQLKRDDSNGQCC